VAGLEHSGSLALISAFDPQRTFGRLSLLHSAERQERTLGHVPKCDIQLRLANEVGVEAFDLEVVGLLAAVSFGDREDHRPVAVLSDDLKARGAGQRSWPSGRRLGAKGARRSCRRFR